MAQQHGTAAVVDTWCATPWRILPGGGCAAAQVQHYAAGPLQAQRLASIAGIARIVRIARIAKIGCRMRGVRPPGAFYPGGGALLLLRFIALSRLRCGGL